MDEVSGGTPETTRQRPVLPGINRTVPAKGVTNHRSPKRGATGEDCFRVWEGPWGIG